MPKRYKFNPPPNWPRAPKGWVPPYGWSPPTQWGPAPPNWQYWTRAGFWQPAYVIPSAFGAVILIIVVAIIGPSFAGGIDTTSDSYGAGYESGADAGDSFVTITGMKLTESGRKRQCEIMFSADSNHRGFEVDGRVIPKSEIDEEEYMAGCDAGLVDFFDDYEG